MLKLTINKPAYDAFLAGDDVKGIAIRLENGVVQFRAADNVEDEDVAPLEERTRGGGEVKIEGYRENDLHDALDNPAGNPFFLLQRAGKGWISAIPFGGGPHAEPPRTLPVMRVWNRTKALLSSEQMDKVGDLPLPRFVDEIRRAKKVVDEYYTKRRPGRPPKDISDQLDLIKLFMNTAVEVMDVQPLVEAQSALRQFSATLGIDEHTPNRPRPAKKTNPKKLKARAKEPKIVVRPEPAPEPRLVPPPAPITVRSLTSKRRQQFENE